jgi:hypothetical protein
MVEPAPTEAGKEPASHGGERAGPKPQGAAAAWREGSRLTHGGPSSGLQAAHQGPTAGTERNLLAAF